MEINNRKAKYDYNILEEIERVIDPSRELFSQVYVEGNFTSLVDRLTELTGDENDFDINIEDIASYISSLLYNLKSCL